MGYRGRGFAAEDDNLYRVAIEGGLPVTLIERIGGIAGATWGPDDTIVLASSSRTPLVRLPAAGGEPQAITELADGERHRWPAFLPGGEALLFTVVKGDGAENMEIWGVYPGFPTLFWGLSGFGSSHKCVHDSAPSRSATPWKEAADVFVPANQR